jgi:hypothetical protein
MMPTEMKGQFVTTQKQNVELHNMVTGFQY